jgi:two-component system chemotaxis response regulator CheB
MQRRDIIVIGSSAGGVNALKQLTSDLPAHLQASIFVVQHMAADMPSYLPQILSNAGPLRAIHPQDGQLIEQGVIYIAPPDHHMIIEDQKILIKKGPKENNFRPAIDALMRSAAYWYKNRVIGVVLTGYLSDGTSGLWSVKQFGGSTVIQDPLDALYPDMPRNVLKYVDVDYVLPLSEIAPLIVELAKVQPQEAPEVQPHTQQRMQLEIEIATQHNAFEKGIAQMGKTSSLTCPECGGALTEIQEGKSKRFRCHTGHGYSSASLLSEITQSIETRLWQSQRSMEEGIMLLEQLAAQQEQAGALTEAEELFNKATLLRKNAKQLLDFIYTKGQIN